ncbi:hypothetical protein GCM10009859_22450 [Kocuria salsicia]
MSPNTTPNAPSVRAPRLCGVCVSVFVASATEVVAVPDTLLSFDPEFPVRVHGRASEPSCALRAAGVYMMLPPRVGVKGGNLCDSWRWSRGACGRFGPRC